MITRLIMKKTHERERVFKLISLEVFYFAVSLG
jgi:hypothetical protein